MNTTLGDISVRNGIQTGPFGSQLHASDYTSAGVGVVMPQDLKGNVVSLEDIAYVSEETAAELERHVLRAGDIVYSRRGDITRRALIRAGGPQLMCGTGCLRVRIDTDSADPAFVSYFLGLSSTREWLRQHAVGATMPNLNTSILSAVPVDLPDLATQRAIGEVLGALDDKIAANRRVSVHAEELAGAVMGKCSQSVRLGDVARQRRSSVSPDRLGTETVLHFSLPAYDAGRAMLESASEIKSAKNEVGDPTVLVSKLNPRIPRLWPIDTAASGTRRLASTEFVALESSDLAVGELWAAILQGDTFGQLQALVGGTSNSHQRVHPQDILDAVVPDPRELEQEDRNALVTLCRLRNQLVEENVILSQTRDHLLPLLMNGRITVMDAERAVEGVV